MNDVGFREARQNHPREIAAGDHGLAGFAPELVIPGAKERIANERWQSRYAHADVAQTGVGVGNERNAGAAADELCVDDERAEGVSRSHRCVGTDREEMESEVKKFWPITLSHKVRRNYL